MFAVPGFWLYSAFSKELTKVFLTLGHTDPLGYESITNRGKRLNIWQLHCQRWKLTTKSLLLPVLYPVPRYKELLCVNKSQLILVSQCRQISFYSLAVSGVRPLTLTESVSRPPAALWIDCVCACVQVCVSVCAHVWSPWQCPTDDWGFSAASQ